MNSHLSECLLWPVSGLIHPASPLLVESRFKALTSTSLHLGGFATKQQGQNGTTRKERLNKVTESLKEMDCLRLDQGGGLTPLQPQGRLFAIRVAFKARSFESLTCQISELFLR